MKNSASFHLREWRMAARRGFTLIELLVSVTILVILLGIFLSVTNSVTSTVGRATAKLDAFASARSAFDLLSQKLSQATLNTYWDYDNPLAPTVYRRESDLQFLVLQNTQMPAYGQEAYFVSPLSFSKDPGVSSTTGLLNACAYFVRYGDDASYRPGVISAPRYRYRLMQGLQATESLGVYNAKPPSTRQEPQWSDYWTTFWNAHAWTAKVGSADAANGGAAAPLAENVIAMLVWSRLSAADDPVGTKLTKDYSYDSKKNALLIPQPITANQLPPTVQVTLVFISEASAARLDTKSSTPPKAIEDALKGRFTDVTKYQEDLDGLSASLAASHIEFQIMNSSVPLRESKWSDSSQ